MRSQTTLLSGTLILIALTSGCAFSKTTVKVDFKPSPTAQKVSFDKTLAVKELSDQRGVDPNLLSYKGDSYKTSGTYVTKKPVASIVSEAIRGTFQVLNYRVVDDGDLVLAGELLRLDSVPIMGGDLDCTIQVNLRLMDKNGRPIWTELITGYNKEKGLQVDNEDHRKKTTEAALKDLTDKLANSTSFRSAIQSYHSSP